jgi:hypothetical protein
MKQNIKKETARLPFWETGINPITRYRILPLNKILNRNNDLITLQLNAEYSNLEL